MRRFALLGLILCLSGCEYQTWWNPPLTGGRTPNMPVADAPNIDRVLGRSVEMTPISPEPGNIWPGPLPESPTLSDLEAESGLTSGKELPVPGSPLSREYQSLMPQTPRGSSTPPPPAGSGVPPALSSTPAVPSYAAPAAAPPPSGQSGQVVQTPSGTSVTTGGTPGYGTAIAPGGSQSIIVPNGNGTSTVIHPDGRIETIPTPK